MARLTAAQRHRLATSDFAGPGRSYPISDAAHARVALARAAQHATPREREQIRAKVHERYPAIGGGKRSVRDENLARFAKAR